MRDAPFSDILPLIEVEISMTRLGSPSMMPGTGRPYVRAHTRPATSRYSSRCIDDIHLICTAAD
jgi:hypothetical protein